MRFSLQDKLEQEAARQIYEKTVRDPLTKLHNRRHLDERFFAEFSYAIRHKTNLSIMIIDVDHFKKINDSIGHQAGDHVLRSLASELLKMVRTEDILARFGGEEFVVIVRGIDTRNTAFFGERIRQCIEHMPIQWKGEPVNITISIGIANMGLSTYSNAEAMLAAADMALYRAKQSGRNRVEAMTEQQNK